MGTWGVAEAEAQFDVMLDKAEAEGAQLVERRKKRFVLLTEEDLTKRTGGVAVTILSGPGSGKASWEALRCPPQDGIDTEFPRIPGGPREVDF